jgi:hypothetical protein
VAVICLGVGLVACSAPASYRSPTFTTAPATTLLMSAVPCLESLDVAAGGEIVRRATGFGPLAVQRVNGRLARKGAASPSLPPSHCLDLTSEQAADPRDFNHPPAPAVIRELAEMSGADSVLVPMVASRFACDAASWRWDQPAYENESGRIDCHEHALTFAAFLYGADGALLWKAVHRYEVAHVPDLAEMAETLLREAPLGAAAPLRHRETGVARDALEALDDIPPEEELVPEASDFPPPDPTLVPPPD